MGLPAWAGLGESCPYLGSQGGSEASIEAGLNVEREGGLVGTKSQRLHRTGDIKIETRKWWQMCRRETINLQGVRVYRESRGPLSKTIPYRKDGKSNPNQDHRK